jgi:restriction system protein
MRFVRDGEWNINRNTMSADIPFHYPPELISLLVDAVPLLNKTKKDVLLFFRGAGVPASVTDPLAQRLKEAPKEITKYEITRVVLEELNARGEAMLRERREVLRRIVEFSNFSSCWPDDQLKARGLVASIREVVDQKDAFTRMHQERDQERRERLSQAAEATRAKRERAEKIAAAKNKLYALFGADMSVQKRGKQLEFALNGLFAAYGIFVRQAFHLVGQAGEGVVEQIDGVIELKGDLYFVEMKWCRTPVAKAEISEHLVRLMSRAQARGIIISASNFTEPAIHVAREFLQHKVVILATLEEIVTVLEANGDLGELFVKKGSAAVIHKNPFIR